jgi:hypothetical protein
MILIDDKPDSSGYFVKNCFNATYEKIIKYKTSHVWGDQIEILIKFFKILNPGLNFNSRVKFF